MTDSTSRPNNDFADEEDLVEMGETWLDQGDFESLARWMDELPAHVVDQHPRLRYLRARCLMHADKWSEAIPDLVQVRHHAIAAEDWSMAIDANLQLARLHQRQEAIALAREYLESAQDLARKHPPAQAEDEAQLAMMIGRLYPDLGDNRQAVVWSNRALRLYEETGDVPGQIEALWLLAVSHCYLADLYEARTHVERALHLNTAHDQDEIQRLYLRNVQAYIELYAGHTEAGLAILEQVAPRRARHPVSKPALYLSMAEGALRQQAGDLEGSLQAYAQAEQILEDLGDAGSRPWLVMERGWTEVLAGKAPNEVRRDLLAVIALQNEATHRNVTVQLALLDVLEERHQDALERLQGSLSAFQNSGELMYVFAIRLYLAHVHLQLGDPQAGHAMLNTALAWAREADVDGFPFLWHPRLVAEVCAEALRAGIYPGQVELMFVRRLGDAGVPALMPLLEEESPVVRRRVQSILSTLGGDVVFKLLDEISPPRLRDVLLDHLRTGRLAMSKLEELEHKLRTAEQYDRANWTRVAIFGYYVADQLTRSEIAGELHVAEATVRNHITDIRRAFGITSRGMEELKKKALHAGFVMQN